MRNLSILFVIIMIFSGCATKFERTFIDNYGLCTHSVSDIVIDSVSIDNKSLYINVSSNDIKTTFEKSLKESGCFNIYKPSSNYLLNAEQTYILNVKATLHQENQIVTDRFFKKDEVEKLILTLYITAHSGDKIIKLVSKSELVKESEKILGFKSENDIAKDKKYLIESATKEATITLYNNLNR
ncbi:hypothetical protein [Arcobacter sp. FWKO B]|uniref:hypothetical protein n=1 Tax=Arcobacter sp. FWKO B TaxID=2593672 RepID=UPI0018A65280|nr:hypothetical protein [Arcobacter sp. FWKO B]QOG11977.1 hypothetical protein FWKOB_04345 [Arcobacter sp. FWKO B]